MARKRKNPRRSRHAKTWAKRLGRRARKLGLRKGEVYSFYRSQSGRGRKHWPGVRRRKNPQVARFPDGGFVLHKITGNWKGNVSAWFDKNGRPLDAEQKSGGFGSPARRVKRGGPIWDRLEIIGKVWK